MPPCPRAEAEAEVDAPPEAAGRDEGEAPHPSISLEQQPLGDAAAERVPNEVELITPSASSQAPITCACQSSE